MVSVEVAETVHAEGICRVCTAGWRDAYADVLPSRYVEANIRTFYRPERIAEQVRSDVDDTWLVALEDSDSSTDERVVGAICDVRSETDIGEVSGLYVSPERRGDGVGSRLLSALTERQSESGVTEQHTFVFADHEDALGFYRSKGFDADERFPAATVDGVNPDCESVRLTRSI
ncbi:GNAT family N-acetyltransferase [Halorussus ruber]|uniref:GNAT family N-acetyltransferase n=1 Tax=Halorussus ruber TaxID=1126238 RepID=UPI00109274FB|nr:GNAT family N-acetyltransferase [Halorussus ruber]